MMRYLNYEQPAQIKKDLNKTIKKYRNQNKKYKQESFEPTQNYLYKRFSVDRNKLTSNQQVSMAHAFICTEFYLAAVINNAYYVPDTCTPIIQRNFGIYIQNKVYKE